MHMHSCLRFRLGPRFRCVCASICVFTFVWTCFAFALLLGLRLGLHGCCVCALIYVCTFFWTNSGLAFACSFTRLHFASVVAFLFALSLQLPFDFRRTCKLWLTKPQFNLRLQSYSAFSCCMSVSLKPLLWPNSTLGCLMAFIVRLPFLENAWLP